MPKQAVPMSFAGALDQKTDDKQIRLGNFLGLTNSVFNKIGRLTKRNGNQRLPDLPDATSTFLTTFSGDLTAIGTSLKAFSSGSGQWVNRGNIQPVELSVLPLVRNNTNQSQCDTALASNGLICSVYTDQTPASLSTPQYKYCVADSATGQVIVAPTVITQADATLGTPRVFFMAPYFIVVFTNKVSSTYHLKYFAITAANPTIVTVPVDISVSYVPAATVAFDGIVFNGSLFLAWNGASSSGIKMVSLTSSLALSSTHVIDASHQATMFSLCVDSSNSFIWVSYYNLSGTVGYAVPVNVQLALVGLVTQIIASGTILNLASTAANGLLTFFYETSHAYGYDSGIPSHFITSNTLDNTGTLGSPRGVIRSVGLASKAVIVSGATYFMVAFQSPYQPTYFLIDASGDIIAKLAYGNGGGYLPAGLPSVSVSGTTMQMGYLFKDLVQAVNKDTNVAAGTQVAGIYSQTGVNLASFTIGDVNTVTAEIGSNLNLSGGFLWGYDGYTPVENNFFVWPDSVEATTSTSGGHLADQQYFYQFTYEWTDNQGNAFRSAPSVPITITTSGGGNSTNTLNVPTLRLTYKIANPVKIVGYRWSAAQQAYYQFTSITAPILNDPTVDSVAITDTLADATIIGNNLIYTTGGVVENINGPAAGSVFIFDDRLFVIPAEDPNNLNFSKQVIPSTPVEMSDLLSLYVAPTLSAQGSSGPLICGAPMDDKAILFKRDAISYINGTGPDNTGANSQYSQPILITTTVGCSNQKSIVFTPRGLMFESDKGIWLLGRDLSTEYIGAPVEDFTLNATVLSAVSVPETNQIRFKMSSGITLMYDYYVGKWGDFEGVPAISSTLFQGLETFINSLGQVFQENPGSYLDGSKPVLISFKTGWINAQGLRGYERIHEFSFLGTYFSPHKLVVQIAYDYGQPSQQSIYSPPNYAPAYGVDPIYGDGSPYGGPSNIEQFRVFPKQQKCRAFQILVQEIFDPSFSAAAGEGLSLSGINMVITPKKGWAPTSGRNSIG